MLPSVYRGQHDAVGNDNRSCFKSGRREGADPVQVPVEAAIYVLISFFTSAAV